MKQIFAILLLMFSNMGMAIPDAQSIVRQADLARGGNLPGILWEIRLKSHEPEREIEDQRLLVRAMDNASVAEVIEPVRAKGTKLLQVEHNMWLSKPGLAKPIPISSRQRMSGQASNGDIAATNYADDYDAKYLKEEPVEGEPCHLLALSAKHKRATYDQIRYWVSVSRGVAIKAEFYSLSGKLLKTAKFEYGNAIDYAGKNIPFVSKMSIRDALIDAETVMQYGKVRVQKIAPAEFDLGQMQ